MLNVETIKRQFPVFSAHPHLRYLDTPASSLTPELVITKLREYYENYPVNVARGLYGLSERATQEMESVRKRTAQFLDAASSDEIVFVRNTTEALNLLARTLLPTFNAGDEILTTAMEHHANFVPWQQLAKKHGLHFRILECETDGTLSPNRLREAITKKTKLFTFVHISNVLGTINDAKKLIETARESNPNIITIVDAAQSAGHLPFSVQDIDCDFLALSSHKLFGPKGVGVLYGKQSRLETLEPFLFGGEMVEFVSDDDTTFRESPHRFEAGTPSIGDCIGFGAALDFVDSIGKSAIAQHEIELATLAWEKLETTFGDDITFVGPHPETGNRAGVLSFSLHGVHPHDAAQILAESEICVRAGTHCAMPIHRRFDIAEHATIRAGFSLYNDASDIDALLEGLRKAQKIFKK
jgi:cysteine desulfurase/selenocysteine lyase